MVQSGPGHGVERNPQSFSTDVVPHEAWWNMKELAKRVILDLGCMRNVVGVQWANDVVEEWQKNGRWLRVLQEDEVFRFGDGNTLRSQYRLQLEATFGGRKVLLAFSVVPGPCPPLLSKQSHTKLGVKLDTEHHTLSSRKLKVQNYGLIETEAGHYTVRIDEFHLLEHDEDSWKIDGPKMGTSEEVALFNVMPPAEAFGSTLEEDHRDIAPVHGRPGVQPSELQTMWEQQPSNSSVPRDLRGRVSEGADPRGAAEGGRVGNEARRSTPQWKEGGTSEHGGGVACGCEPPQTKEDATCEQGDTSHRVRRSSGVHGCRVARSRSGGGRNDPQTPSKEECNGSEEAAEGSLDRMGGRLNPKWLSYLLSYEIAALWGHFGSMRQRLRNTDFLTQLQQRKPNQ